MADREELAAVSALADREMILAQEQAVSYKISAVKEYEGTLVLTHNRLLFVEANTEDVLNQGNRIRYAEVESLDSVGQAPANLSIPLDSITEVKGDRGIMTKPNLKVKYEADGGQKQAEFVQTVIGGRRKNLNDWAKVINNLKSGKIQIKIPTWVPPEGSLEARIVECLSDLQEKGTLQIEEEIENKYKIDLDPDQVESACNNLVKEGILEKKEEDFYRLPSPLGEDDLSS